MSNATTTTTPSPAATAKAVSIFCAPTATDSTTLTHTATTTDITAANHLYTTDEVATLRSLIDEAAQAEHLQATSAGLSGEGVSHLDESSRLRVEKAFLLLCRGKRWKEISEQTGLTWSVFDVYTRPKAIKKVSIAAQERRDQSKFAEILEAAQEEAANDDVDPVIGRIGKDLDGIVKDDQGKPIIKKRHNTKMRELFLKAHDKRFRDSGSEQDKGAGSRPIVYNIAFIGGPAAAVALQQAKPAIEATFTETQGGNQAAKSPFG